MYFGFISASHHMILLLLESPDIGLPNHKNWFSAYGQTCKLPVWINLPVSRVSSLHVAYMAGHVSIRGTDEQIGDALVVLGKRITRKRIHTPKPKKKTELTAGELKAALACTWAEAPRVSYGRPSAGYPPHPTSTTNCLAASPSA